MWGGVRKRGHPVVIRCLVDGLLLPASLRGGESSLVAYDGEDRFTMEAVEAVFYEVVSATRAELLGLERARYRLLRQAEDFVCLGT
jgi:hypothetical protein